MNTFLVIVLNTYEFFQTRYRKIKTILFLYEKAKTVALRPHKTCPSPTIPGSAGMENCNQFLLQASTSTVKGKL